MVIEFKYKDSKGKSHTIIKNLETCCIDVNRVYISAENRYYWIDRRELHLEEPKIVVWLKGG